jgi:hypothetical protein
MMIKRKRRGKVCVSLVVRADERAGEDLPDLDLALAELEVVGDLNALPSGEVFVEVELLLELEGLVAGVRLSGALRAFAEIWLEEERV